MGIIKGFNDDVANDKEKGFLNEDFAYGIEEELNQLFGIVETSTGNRTKLNSKHLLQMNISWVYACVDAIAEEVGQTELYLKKINKNGDVEIIKDHPVLEFIYKANDVFTKFDLLKLTQVFLDIAGEAPWYIVKNGKTPVKTLLLDPTNLTVIPAVEGSEDGMVSHYMYKVSENNTFKEIRIETDELVFLKNPNPLDQFRGRSPLEAILNTHELDIISEQFNKDFFRMSAQPSMILTTEQKVKQDQLDNLQKRIKDRYEGYKNSHKTLILTGGLKMEKSMATHSEMQFIEQQKYSRDKIMATYRVPKSILGLTEDVNRANAESGEYVFAKRVIVPKLKRITEQLNEFLLPMFGLDHTYFIDFEDPVPENVEQKLKVSTESYNMGIATRNEARELIGLEPVKDGDNFKEVVGFPTQTTPSKIAKKKYVNKTAYTRAKRAWSESNKKEKVNDRVKAIVTEKLRQITYTSLAKQMSVKNKKDLKKTIEENKNKLFKNESEKLGFQKAMHNIADQFEPKFQKQMELMFKKQEKIILDSLDKLSPDEKPDPKKLTLNVQNQVEEYEKRFIGLYNSLIVAQAKLTMTLLGKSKKIDKMFATKDKLTRYSDFVRQYVGYRAIKIATETTEYTNEKVIKLITDELLTEESSIPKISKALREMFDGMEIYRAERIARTESGRASNFATKQSYIESGVVEAQEWLTAIDERTCPYCFPLNGKIIPLNDNWFQKGDSYVGLDGTVIKFDYETIEFPPLHANCRCTTIPVL